MALSAGGTGVNATSNTDLRTQLGIDNASNLLSGTLQEQRLSALEATALLRTVMFEIEVAIFAFDQAGRLAYQKTKKLGKVTELRLKRIQPVELAAVKRESR